MSSLSAAGGAVALPGAATARPQVNKWLVTVSITFGTLMGAIDASIVNVAIPHLRGAVGATVEEITWVSTGFAIATVLVTPLTAFLGAMFGQKRVYLFCLALFVAGSILCGQAHTLTSLVIYRAIQGLGAGALQPTEQAILRTTWPPEEQGMASALFGMAVMIGPAVGPTLGGFIVDNYSWPWIFYINVPVGILGFLLVTRFVHEEDDVRAANRVRAAAQRKNLDWQGIALLSLGLATMQYVLEEGNRNDWFSSHTIVALTLLSVFALAAFTIREVTAPVPAVNLRLFRDRTFLSGTLLGMVMFAMLLSGMFLLPVFMQEILGFTAMQSGLTLLPRVLVMMIATPIIGRLYNRVSPRLIVGIGIVAFSIGAFQMSRFTLESSQAQIIRANLIQGLAFACLFVPLITTALGTIPRKYMSDATGLNSLFRLVGGSFGLAIFATLLNRYAVAARSALAAQIREGRVEVQARIAAITQGLMAHGADAVSAKQGALAYLQGTVARQGMVLAFEKTFLVSGVCFLFVLPLLYFLRRAPVGAGGRPDVHMEM